MREEAAGAVLAAAYSPQEEHDALFTAEENEEEVLEVGGGVWEMV